MSLTISSLRTLDQEVRTLLHQHLHLVSCLPLSPSDGMCVLLLTPYPPVPVPGPPAAPDSPPTALLPLIRDPPRAPNECTYEHPESVGN